MNDNPAAIVAILTGICLLAFTGAVGYEVAQQQYSTADLKPSSIVHVERQWSGEWERVDVKLPPADALRFVVEERK